MAEPPEEAQIKINHNQDDFLEGENYVLTMKDTDILKDGDINEDEEELVNANIDDNHRHKIYLKNKAKVKGGKHGLYNGNDFDQHGELKKRGILDKYDLEEEEREGMLLNLKNNKINKKGRLTTDAANIQGAEKTSMVTKKVFNSDFLIEEEPIQLGRNKKFKKAKKRNLKKKKKLLENMEELLAEEVEGEDHLKTREERIQNLKAKEIEHQAEENQKRENYQKAVLKANLKTSKLLNEDFEEDDDYLLLEKSNANKRRLIEKKEKDVTQNFSQSCMSTRRKKKSKRKMKIKDKKNAKEIKDLTDLTKSSIQTEKDRQDLAQILTSSINESFANTKSGMTSVVNVALPSQRLQSQVQGLQSVVQSREYIERKELEEEKIRDEIKNKEITKEDEEKAEILEEPIVGKGVANVMKIFRMRNMFNQKADLVGRMKDNKAGGEFDAEREEEDDIMIHRTDKYGNPMSRKEAYREFSYAYHGMKPSQSKREKMRKRLEKAQKASNLISGDKSFYMKALKNEQKRKKKAFMVIDTKPKARIQL
ncbi:unnamed protein product [Moneuplotes crassus]|uniref:SART-1 family protein n=1 Tax=Euplotes crassus TaxID=5936 RepID=A0AAD1UDY2_EUPCR|nr:unnamed protein product [Moneuplotes crassus]